MSHKQTFVVTVTSDKPISNLGAKIGNRLWTMDTVSDVKTFAVRHLGGTLEAQPDGSNEQTTWLVETTGGPL